MSSLQALRGAIAIAYIVCTSACVVFGQELPGTISVTGAGTPPMLLATQPQGAFTTSSDVLFGAGSKGPYSLSRKPINRFSESVSIDNQLMARDFDYQVDYTVGAITFVLPVNARSVVKIEYSYDPSKAVVNRAPMSVPLSLDLLKRQNAALRFTGLYKQADPAARSASDVAVYGLTGDTTSGQMQLSSMFLYSNDMAGTKSELGDRAAIRLGSSTKTDNLRITTSYLHVGERFVAAKDFSLQQGVDAMEASAVYTPGKSLSLSSTYKRDEALTGEKKGQAVATAEHKVVVTPDGAPKLTLSRTEVDKEKPGIADLKTTTDRIQLEQQLGSRASAVATRESVATESGGSETQVTTNRIVLDAKPSDAIAVQSRIAQKESSVDGSETGYGMDISAAPSKTMSMKASLSRVDAEKTGRSAGESLNLVANPSKLLSLDMKVAHRNADASGDELAHNVKIVSNPGSNLRLEVGLTGRNVDRPEDEFARTFMLSTTAFRNVAIQLDWAGRESDIKGPEEVEGIRVVTTPIQAVKLSGALSRKQTAGVQDVSREAAVEVRPFTHTTLGGAYREVESNGTVVSRVSEVSASSKPGKIVEVSGGYKTREYTGQEDLDTLNVAMQLDTGGLLKVTGAYSSNPEDAKGVVQRFNAETFGVKTNFGRLKLKGAYTLKDEYLAGRSAEQRDYGLDYRLSAYSLLTTGYSVDQRRDISLLQTNVYSLGYSHRVGNRVNLYLNAKMMTYERDRVLMGEQTEYEGEARIGLKF